NGQEGKLLTLRADSWIFLAPQFSNPEPADLADLRVRQALSLAIDRPSLADAIAGDGTLAGDLWLPRSDPQYRTAAASVRQQTYDPNAAVDLLAQAGWRRDGPDNGLVKHGQRFSPDLTTTVEWHSTAAIVADYWRQVGVDPKESVVSLGNVFDRQNRATYSGAELMAGPPGLSLLDSRLRSTNAPASDNFFAGANRGHYTNPDADRLLDRVWGTLDPSDRARALGDLTQLIALELPISGLFFYPAMMLVRADVRGVRVPEAIAPTGPVLVSWNAHEWEKK
ncbi:MAG TPA: ABC transporter substrate-binding protein, partial [Chloroflexota bacterium]